MFAQHPVDLRSLGQVGKQAGQPDQHAVLVNAGMPVVAAIKGRMQRARRLGIVRTIQHMLQVVGIFAADIGQAEPGELGGLGGRKGRENGDDTG